MNSLVCKLKSSTQGEYKVRWPAERFTGQGPIQQLLSLRAAFQILDHENLISNLQAISNRSLDDLPSSLQSSSLKTPLTLPSEAWPKS
ncbi:hypothetical protein AVEN_86710-1 [Araneus ventricosus]|uniref:Uncharacterized protein n=1 Tax=Araneus ventricosus TaxID=182803 RepID=A0A4Y2J181_ARAVE|nr:hypothetical protein AVEN_86710-1 [Araneus ventricosus]